MKIPKNASIEGSILNLNKVLSFSSYRNELWEYFDAKTLEKLSDDQVLKKLCYYLNFKSLFQKGKVESLKGYQYKSHKHMPFQMANPQREVLLWNEVRKRIFLNDFLTTFTIFIEV